MAKNNTYASLVWTAQDIKTLRPRWSLFRCEAFLVRVERKIQDRLCELGWEVIEAILEMEKRN